MDTIFLYAAVVGGTVLVVQTLLMVLGFGDHADTDLPPDLDTTGSAAGAAADVAMLKVLTFKGIVAFVTFFGLTGMLARSFGLTEVPSLTLGVTAGVASMFLVAWLMAALVQLQSTGTFDLAHSVGHSAHVYLRVPAEGAQGGRVHVTVRGRRVECKAVTAGPEIPPGAEVQVVRVVDGDVLEVRARG